jgi:RNA recognition motif-containing protein
MKLYVGNLSYQITSEDLLNYFGQIGPVASARVVTESTGRSRGFAFVEMGDTDAGHRAIEEFDGTEAIGRRMVVKLAVPKN